MILQIPIVGFFRMFWQFGFGTLPKGKEEPPSQGMAVADWPSSPVVTSKNFKTSIPVTEMTMGKVEGILL